MVSNEYLGRKIEAALEKTKTCLKFSVKSNANVQNFGQTVSEYLATTFLGIGLHKSILDMSRENVGRFTM